MPGSSTLHGAAPDEHAFALLILDLISDFRFPDGKRLLRAALPVAKRIARLKQRAVAAGVPVIYVNDNRGKWRSDRAQLIAHCLATGSPGRTLVGLLKPRAEDYYLFKPKHSGFFATPLAALLRHLGTRRLIVTGVTVEQCVLFTAIDAYLRDFELVVPHDCVAGLTQVRFAREHLRRILKARTAASTSIRFHR